MRRQSRAARGTTDGDAEMKTEPTEEVVEYEDGHHSMGVPKRKRADHDESVKCDRRGQYYGHGCQVGGDEGT